MTWSWSHTSEAYADAEANLRDMPVQTLREIWAEWLATDTDYPHDDADYSGFSPSLYSAALADVEALDVVSLADMIWDAASEQATCDNGGWNAWLCPHGCGPHCVPFDRPEPLTCPECGEPIWDIPHGFKLAKCWNTDGHFDGRTFAFDTIDDDERQS